MRLSKRFPASISKHRSVDTDSPLFDSVAFPWFLSPAEPSASVYCQERRTIFSAGFTAIQTALAYKTRVRRSSDFVQTRFLCKRSLLRPSSVFEGRSL